MGKTIDIGGRIHNPEVGNVVTGANEILDDTKNKKQDVINGEVDAALEALDANKQDNLTFDQTPTESSTNPVTSGGVYAADLALQQAIEAILTLIPSAASALNQLADKSFVNSSIETASATFRGTYNLVSDLHLSVTASHQDIATALASAVSTADNNDYCFVQIPTSDTSSDIRVTERYKFNGTAWAYEYDLNNSGFTATQWEAINSGITALLVTKLGALPTAAELATSLAGKQSVLTFDNVPVSGSDNPVKSGGIYQLFTAIDAKFPSDASSSNKLVAENRLAAYVTAIIEALDASFDLTSADGHITFRMTQTNGVIASVQILTSDIASASALTTLGGRVSTNETDIANLQAAYAGLTQSDVIVGTLPSSGQQQNIIYRQPDQDHTPPQFYSDYMWNGSTWVLMAQYNNAIDPSPKKGSQNLVTSGGVFDNMGALDVSELNATENPHTLATYADLSAALAAIPSDYQKGGMSIKFVQSSDNKYVQYRLMVTTWSTNVSDWQGVDDAPTAGSNNLVKSGWVSRIQNASLIQKITPIIANNNAYIHAVDGTVRNGGDASYTEPITLKPYQTIVVTCMGYSTNVAIISEVITANTKYKPLVPSYDKKIHDFIYSNDSLNDISIALSFINSGGCVVVIGNTDSLVGDYMLNVFKKTSLYYEKQTEKANISGDAYIRASDGGVSRGSGSNGSYTKPITLPNGYTIVAKCKGYNTAVAIISEVEEEDVQYTPLVVSIDSSIREYSYKNQTGKSIQVAISYLNDGGIECLVYFDCSQGVFFPQNADKTQYYPLLDPIFEIADMLGIVKDWGFIGDSLTSGQIYYMRSDNVQITKLFYRWSWGQCICDLCRTNGTNFSVGGATAKSWIQRYWTNNDSEYTYKTGGGHEVFRNSPKPVYTICLGTNDVNTIINESIDPSTYIGSWSDVDISDFENNADTFYGNYAGIIQRIKSIQPSARIFIINLCQLFHTSDIRLSINTAIANIQSHFVNTYLIDLETLCPISNEIVTKYTYGGHMTVQGYQWLSYVIGNIITNVIRGNVDKFDALPFIGTDVDNGSL